MTVFPINNCKPLQTQEFLNQFGHDDLARETPKLSLFPLSQPAQPLGHPSVYGRTQLAKGLPGG